MSFEEINKEEIMDIVDGDTRNYVPMEGVIFSKKRLNRVVQRLAGPKPRKKKNRSRREEVREFMNEQEEELFKNEFGPFTSALINEQEREYCRRRKDELINSGEFDIDPILDLNTIMVCIMDEVILQRLLTLYADTPTTAIQNQITNVQKRLRENLKVLDATREQRNRAIAEEEERKNNKVMSVAQLVSELEKTKSLRLREQTRYAQEEQELLNKIALKPPIEIDAIEIYEDEEDEGEIDAEGDVEEEKEE